MLYSNKTVQPFFLSSNCLFILFEEFLYLKMYLTFPLLLLTQLLVNVVCPTVPICMEPSKIACLRKPVVGLGIDFCTYFSHSVDIYVFYACLDVLSTLCG